MGAEEEDPFYSWIGLDNPLMYAAHKAAGGMTSIYRQVGIGCERLLRTIIRDELSLSEAQATWSYEAPAPTAGKPNRTKTLSLDGRIHLPDVKDQEKARLVHEWIKQRTLELGVKPQIADGLQGVVFEVRQGYKSKDSKRQNADIANAAVAYTQAYLPCLTLFSTQIDDDLIARYRIAKASGLSVLEYLLGDHRIIPASHGVFLDVTWRMHPWICDFVSESTYEGRLRPRGENRNRVVRLPKEPGRIKAEAGMVFLPVEHGGNTHESAEEVALVVDVVKDLLGRELTDVSGKACGQVGLDDILIVAPFNVQVRRIRSALPDGARVGTVDKFQGQQAPVVVVSICCSPTDLGQHHVKFALDRRRLNVAVSRAESLAVVVGNPEVARSRVGNLPDCERLNLFCRLCGPAD